ncbi:MAG: multiubiquitin domain-containing protein [Holophagaceae bacterium]
MTNDSSAQAQGGPHHEFKIQIDRVHYEVAAPSLTGTQLRAIPTPPIGPERDLFEVIPGGDRKIGDSDVVEIHNGQRFFTAPAHITPGSGAWKRKG